MPIVKEIVFQFNLLSNCIIKIWLDQSAQLNFIEASGKLNILLRLYYPQIVIRLFIITKVNGCKTTIKDKATVILKNSTVSDKSKIKLTIFQIWKV
jgi:hypothetical protein